MHSQSRKPIFTIDIRVSGQSMSIPVYEGENHEELVRRFCEQHVFKADYKEAIKDKIIESLMESLRRVEISGALRRKVDGFLMAKDNKSRQKSKQKQSRVHSKQKSQRSQKDISQASTPFKMLGHHNISNSQSKRSTNRHVGAHVHAEPQPQPQTYSQKQLKEVQVKKYTKPACIRKNKPQSNPQKPVQPAKSRASLPKPQALISPNAQSQSRSQYLLDTDLIQAYETIYRKTKQPHMKSMAKKFLEQCGHFRTGSNISGIQGQGQRDRKIVDPSAEFKRLCKEQTEDKGEEASAPVADGNSNYTYSLNKFSVIEPSQIFQPSKSKSKSPEVRRNSPVQNPIKPSPKKPRIKYDIGEQPSHPNPLHGQGYEKYNTENYNYSRFQRSPQGQGPRASLSYQRLPYYGQEAAGDFQDRSSFRNSRNLSVYNEPERAISLRRTRKYKYL